MDTRTIVRRQMIQMAAFVAVATVIGVVLALAIDWFPDAGSTQAGPIDTMYDVLMIASVPIFMLCQAVVLFCVWKFRMKPGEELKDGPPIHGNTRLEVVWTVLPALLLVSLCTYAYVVLVDIERKPANEMVVDVTGQQFAWTYAYRGPDGKSIRTDQLYLPVGKSVEFRVKAADVIHDFWVPAFRMKIDAVPGEVTRYRVTPSHVANHSVVCAELCGLGHATMRSSVHVVKQDQSDQWLTRQRATQSQAGAPAAS